MYTIFAHARVTDKLKLGKLKISKITVSVASRAILLKYEGRRFALALIYHFDMFNPIHCLFFSQLVIVKELWWLYNDQILDMAQDFCIDAVL